MALFMLMIERPLQDWNVVVTRPARQAQALCNALLAQGAVAIRFPSLVILPPSDDRSAQACIARLSDYGLAIFISANAVERALAMINQPLPEHLQLAVIGKASAKALYQHGYQADIMPSSGFDSEALLTLPALQSVANRSIVIFRGEGGRGLLGDTLRARGARVDYAQVYRRARPDIDPSTLLDLWARDQIHAITVSSNEVLNNFVAMLATANQYRLYNTPLVVISARGQQLARQLGFKHITVATDASDQAIIAALIKLKTSI